LPKLAAMMSAHADTKPSALPFESRPKSTFDAPPSRFRRVFSRRRGEFSEELSCAHEFVFDEINDVYCRHCRKDFT